MKLVVGPDGPEYVPTTPADDTQAAADAAAWVQSLTPQALSATDLAKLNAILIEPGSIIRGLGLVVLDLANGKIPIKASGDPNPYTAAQLVNLIQAKMR